MLGKIFFVGSIVYGLAFGQALIEDQANPNINQQLAAKVSSLDQTTLMAAPTTPALVKNGEAILHAGEEKAISGIHGDGGDSKLALVLSLIESKAKVLESQVEAAIHQNGGTV